MICQKLVKKNNFVYSHILERIKWKWNSLKKQAKKKIELEKLGKNES